jgi:dTDP-4-amino-4,6-dideoxygalactose transaminase
MKNFGFAGYDNVIYIGTNGKMSEISAAMGLTNLESIDDFIHINKNNYREYLNGLKGVPGIKCIKYDETEKRNYQYIALIIDEDTAGVSRNRIMEILHAENIMARRYFYPGCHKMEPYRSYFPHASLLLPHTERVSHQVLLLPTGSTISSDDIKTICDIIRMIVDNSQSLKKD